MVESFSREDNFFLESDNSAMKIFKLFLFIEFQGGQVILNITIRPPNIRGARMEKSE